MFCDTDIYVNVERKIFNKKYKIPILAVLFKYVILNYDIITPNQL